MLARARLVLGVVGVVVLVAVSALAQRGWRSATTEQLSTFSLCSFDSSENILLMMLVNNRPKIATCTNTQF